MSFGDAFQYPFSSGKFNKIAQIALVFGILSALQMGINFDTTSGATNNLAAIGVIIGSIGFIFFSLFLSGYGTFVIQNLTRDNRSLPEFQIGSSIKRGFQILLASIVYMLPVVILSALLFGTIFYPVLSRTSTVLLSDADYVYDLINSNGYMISGALLVLIPFALLFSYALQIGMVRFAIEDYNGNLWEFGTNIKLVTSNLGKVGKLFWWQMGIAILFAIISVVILMIYGFAIGAMTSLPFMFLIFAIYGVGNSYFSTSQGLSNLYLLAGFAEEIGLVSGKAKNDNRFDDAYEF